MSDPRYMHKFLPNRHDRCKQVVGGEICALPRCAEVHVRWEKYIEAQNKMLAEFSFSPPSRVKRMN